jgi:hypothetical protein
MSDTKAPTAETEQEAGTQPASTDKKTPAGDESQKTDPTYGKETADDTGKSRQRFFSQTEVNRIVKREIERALKNTRLPELEAAQAKVTELETQIKHKELRQQVTEAAVKAGAKNANLLFRAIEEKLELGDDGKPKNLDEVLRQARHDYPELFAAASRGNANGGAGQQNNPRPSMNELLRRSR